MKVAFRADGSPAMGTGHVMRCVTLATSARNLGHEPLLALNHTGVEWLEEYIVEVGIPVKRVPARELSVEQFVDFGPDRVLIDSYVYSDAEINAIASSARTAVIVDFNTRTATAAMYIDPNLGGVAREPHSAEWLVGSNYAMIRPAILEQRYGDCAAFDTAHPRILVFIGGSDPLGLTGTVVTAAIDELPGAVVTAIGGDAVRSELFEAGYQVTVVAPGPELPRLMGEADIVVCAAGTSAWDVSAIGKPAVFLGIVDNQMVSVAQIREHDLGPVIDARGLTRDEIGTAVRASVREVVADSRLRRKRVTRMKDLFDGLGAERIIRKLAGE